MESSQIAKDECNLVILGHVNTGKSTLCGRILLDLDIVDNREIDKLKQEASKCKMDSWYLAYLLDQDK